MLHRIDFEIGIYPNRIQISDRRTGRFVDFAAESAFSSPQRLIGDPVYFEHALAKAMRKALSGGFMLYDAQAHVAPSQVSRDPGDRRAIRRALRDIGFKTVHFEGGDPDERAPTLPASFASLLHAPQRLP